MPQAWSYLSSNFLSSVSPRVVDLLPILFCLSKLKYKATRGGTKKRERERGSLRVSFVVVKREATELACAYPLALFFCWFLGLEANVWQQPIANPSLKTSL
mmetsp:Transcript_10053/g.10972  ORF Transcript_10053/g.10972 Transcript_10053/m.10972 type:complete len:101 (+) Transcript_10053:290-592(+)